MSELSRAFSDSSRIMIFICESSSGRPSPWKQINSTSSKTAFRTSRRAPPSCGGIYDFDTKQERLTEVVKLLEDPKVWEDSKRAQELGRERRLLEGIVSSLQSVDAGLADSRELFDLARSDSDA